MSRELFPIDPDVDEAEDARHHRGAPQLAAARLRFRPRVLALVFVGGCGGGLLRYAVTRHWPTSSTAFPWPTFAVNVIGAFVLAALVAGVASRERTRAWLRPLLGTGVCGALTTFSSLVVAVDRLAAHGRLATGVGYLLLSIVAGLAAATLGLLGVRAVTREAAG